MTIKMSNDDIEKAALILRHDLHEFTTMIFGLQNASKTLKRVSTVMLLSSK